MKLTNSNISKILYFYKWGIRVLLIARKYKITTAYVYLLAKKFNIKKEL